MGTTTTIIPRATCTTRCPSHSGPTMAQNLPLVTSKTVLDVRSSSRSYVSLLSCYYSILTYCQTKYTMAANPGPGFLCHQCAKASGSDPFKKPTPKKRKTPADKRTIVNFEEKRFPTLVSMCIQVSLVLSFLTICLKFGMHKLITKHINDIEALGDIGGLNMEAISRALAKNRSLCVKPPLHAYTYILKTTSPEPLKMQTSSTMSPTPPLLSTMQLVRLASFYLSQMLTLL